MVPRSIRVGALILVVGAGCARSPTVITSGGYTIRRVPLDVGGARGLSDLTIDPKSGQLYAVAERERLILPLRLDGEHPGLSGPAIPLDGVPDGWDTEAITVLSDGRYALGTETRAERRTEVILLAERPSGSGAGRAVVRDRIELALAPWGLVGRSNEGLEGVCAAGGQLAAVVETASERQGGRYAALGRRAQDGTWTAYRLLLGTRKGKVSALACRETGDGTLELLAIERHMETSRLLRFRLPAEGADLTPELALDLGAILDPVPNLEGVVWLPSGAIALIEDDSHKVWGATEAIVVTPR